MGRLLLVHAQHHRLQRRVAGLDQVAGAGRRVGRQPVRAAPRRARSRRCPARGPAQRRSAAPDRRPPARRRGPGRPVPAPRRRRPGCRGSTPQLDAPRTTPAQADRPCRRARRSPLHATGASVGRDVRRPACRRAAAQPRHRPGQHHRQDDQGADPHLRRGLRPRPEHRRLRADVRARQGDAAGARRAGRDRDRGRRTATSRATGWTGTRTRCRRWSSSAAQLGVLALAAEFWRTRPAGGRHPGADQAAGGRGAPAGAEAVLGLAPRVHPAGPALGPLLDAAAARQAVRFTYRAASTGEVRDRTVEPWRLLASRGGWYLVGLDRDRGAPRVFRLSRIVGPGATRRGGRRLRRAARRGPARDAGLRAGGRGAHRVARRAARAGRARSAPGRDPQRGATAPPRPRAGTSWRCPTPAPATWPTRSRRTPTPSLVLGPASLRESVLRRLRDAVGDGRAAGGEPDG